LADRGQTPGATDADGFPETVWNNKSGSIVLPCFFCGYTGQV